MSRCVRVVRGPELEPQRKRLSRGVVGRRARVGATGGGEGVRVVSAPHALAESPVIGAAGFSGGVQAQVDAASMSTL